jgi:hypothetical protein
MAASKSTQMRFETDLSQEPSLCREQRVVERPDGGGEVWVIRVHDSLALLEDMEIDSSYGARPRPTGAKEQPCESLSGTIKPSARRSLRDT